MIVPDNMLAVGTTAPVPATASGKTGYFHIVTETKSGVTTPTGQIDYYTRATGAASESWTKRTTQKYQYTWNFRDSSNNSYTDTDDTPTPIRYAMTHDTQFVYISSDTVNNKITAVVKVEI